MEEEEDSWGETLREAVTLSNTNMEIFRTLNYVKYCQILSLKVFILQQTDICPRLVVTSGSYRIFFIDKRHHISSASYNYSIL